MPAATQDPRAKARKLVALAANNPSKNEGRNAAVAACKLIHEHDLLSAPSSKTDGVDPMDVFIRAHAIVTDPKVREAARAVSDLAGELLKKRASGRK